MKNVKC